MINVTKTFLPPQEEYNAILKRAWNAGWITNRGALVQELEEKLKTYLKIPNIIVTTNGTLPLQIAIKALGLKGEIITTPFSYVATTSSIIWEGCTPVFVDIHPEYFTIDETKIEAAITPKTRGILATHVFGNPCAVEEIEAIAKRHNLKVIYDAAHCFGVTYKNKSIFEFGDVSTCSFHATKVFHTGEGGAMFTNNTELFDTLFYHHNFGHNGPLDFYGLGVNAKMSELQAAMGLVVFPYIDEIIIDRKEIVRYYKEHLKNVQLLKLREETQWNFSYFPVIFKTEEALLKVQKDLNENSVYPRRYFYPSLDKLPYIEARPCSISQDISRRILCLPLFYNLDIEIQKNIIQIINKAIC
ncbi:DegT/DnrJ/EryC1/StrS family aminotransferase [Aequorivita sp. SDUM287046]|uniref:DegT/DnrJ/EryC1/StrS family aminotransferase n=1 Tax=Aequorivita aurantiaca TaxID=3053356 RepID=A0ABT8DJQ5_9FLAO|nr:DegT/DnrJ/EryC1/StrS family aminotransferase [Aequorivita aurantiaca]MDN3725278.1 DegT/DnrJ/EryC1/StrS family aminotransferase [Aequorivita aurantiaca]